MLNYINNLEIKNYKSIKDMQFECSRINLFIGKPNVGKSNILEAVSLLGNLPDQSGKKFFSDDINYKIIHNLFTDNIIDNPICILTDNSYAAIKFFKSKSIFGYFIDLTANQLDMELLNKTKDYEIYSSLFMSNNLINTTKLAELKTTISIESDGSYSFFNFGDTKSKVFNYKFKRNADFNLNEEYYLLPPNGNNLFRIINTNETLRNFITTVIKDYGLEMFYFPVENDYKLLKKSKGIAYYVHFSLLADTLQRIIFYKAAIYSNSDSVLIFEEPEVNSFPPYIQELARDIVDSKTNQFFISTHSPYLLNTILDSAGTDVGLYIVDYKNNETVIKKLSEQEISEILDYGTDIFLNIKDYSIDD